MSSRIDHDTGIVTISSPCYATMAPGHELYVIGTYASARSAYEAVFADYVSRLLLSRPSNGVRVNEVRVQPPDGALLEALGAGLVHESLVAEPL